VLRSNSWVFKLPFLSTVNIRNIRWVQGRLKPKFYCVHFLFRVFSYCVCCPIYCGGSFGACVFGTRWTRFEPALGESICTMQTIFCIKSRKNPCYLFIYLLIFKKINFHSHSINLIFLTKFRKPGILKRVFGVDKLFQYLSYSS
jgi:hypothetical protein